MNSGTARQPSKGPFVLSILIITVGIGWLLSAQGIGRGIDWVWTLGLGVVGFLTFILSGGCDKLSVVLGPFFLVASLLSVLRQTGQLNINTEMPILVIVVGILLMIAQSKHVPLPSWFIPFDEHGASPQ